MQKLIYIFCITLFAFACSQSDDLSQAINTGDIQKVAELIAKGTDVNKTRNNNDKWTPLMSACSTKQTDIVKMLLKAGADVNMADSMDRTALMYAIRNNDINTVKLLLSSGANVNVVETVGKGPFEGKPVKVMSGNGWSPLMYAVYYSGIDTVKALLDSGVDVNLKTVNGNTALKLAQKIRNKEIGMQIRDSELTVEEAGGIENYMQLQQQQVDKQFDEIQEIIKLLKSAGAKE